MYAVHWKIGENAEHVARFHTRETALILVSCLRESASVRWLFVVDPHGESLWF